MKYQDSKLKHTDFKQSYKVDLGRHKSFKSNSNPMSLARSLSYSLIRFKLAFEQTLVTGKIKKMNELPAEI